MSPTERRLEEIVPGLYVGQTMEAALGRSRASAVTTVESDVGRGREARDRALPAGANGHSGLGELAGADVARDSERGAAVSGIAILTFATVLAILTIGLVLLFK
jgi:hypothetical protein